MITQRSLSIVRGAYVARSGEGDFEMSSINQIMHVVTTQEMDVVGQSRMPDIYGSRDHALHVAYAQAVRYCDVHYTVDLAIIEEHPDGDPGYRVMRRGDQLFSTRVVPVRVKFEIEY